MNRFDDMDKKDLQVIKTIGEDGEEVNLKLLDIVSINDLDYALLLPSEEDYNEDDEECEVILMRLIQDKSEYIFETIDDDEEFNMVSEAILSDDLSDDDEE